MNREDEERPMPRPMKPASYYTPADYERMAENCEAAALRLSRSENPSDRRDAAVFAAVAKRHRGNAEKGKPATYWWTDRS